MSIYFELDWNQSYVLSKVQVQLNYWVFFKHFVIKAQPNKLNKVLQGLNTTLAKAGGCRIEYFQLEGTYSDHLVQLPRDPQLLLSKLVQVPKVKPLALPREPGTCGLREV